MHKTFAEPFDYLQMYVDSNALRDGVTIIWEQKQEGMLWDMYLAYAHARVEHKCDKPFVDWKEETIGRHTMKQVEGMSKKEVDTAVNKAEDILKGFKPKGG